MYIWDCRSHPTRPAASPEPVDPRQEGASLAPNPPELTEPDAIAERRWDREAKSPALVRSEAVEVVEAGS